MTRLDRPWRHASVALLAAALTAACGGGTSTAGGNAVVAAAPLAVTQLAVLIAEGDATSEAIGLAYQRARGVPEANMIRVLLPAHGDSIAADMFSTLKSTIDARLPAGVQATLVTWMQPSRVLGSCSMSLTSALAFGYDARYCNAAGTCGATSTSALYDSASHRPWTDHQVRPSMMLGASTLAEAQTIISRGVAADVSLSTGTVTGQAWLVRTSDTDRSVRWDDFRTLAAANVPGVTMNYVDNSNGTAVDAVTHQRNVLFYFTGLPVVPDIATNTYLPGAVADHLTSSGGFLPDGHGQMPITDWLKAGVTASYGTVEEPCNFTQKFPRASVLVKHYQAGDTLIEAYWKSVQWPGQGLFVGEPLARPWGR